MHRIHRINSNLLSILSILFIDVEALLFIGEAFVVSIRGQCLCVGSAARAAFSAPSAVKHPAWFSLTSSSLFPAADAPWRDSFLRRAWCIDRVTPCRSMGSAITACRAAHTPCVASLLIDDPRRVRRSEAALFVSLCSRGRRPRIPRRNAPPSSTRLQKEEASVFSVVIPPPYHFPASRFHIDPHQSPRSLFLRRPNPSPPRADRRRPAPSAAPLPPARRRPGSPRPPHSPPPWQSAAPPAASDVASGPALFAVSGETPLLIDPTGSAPRYRRRGAKHAQQPPARSSDDVHCLMTA
jgi:hypothetical protein